ncbi:Uncharacterised protein [uncultured archaeon]|nr:Uncharacterised protein [uncultured archaeon]
MAVGNSDDGMRLLFKGLAAMFVLIGLAIFVSVVVYAILRPGQIAVAPFDFGWGFFWNIIGFLFTVWIVVWLIRLLFGGRHPRRYWGYDEREIARRRYAKGRINRKEYLEILKDLDNTKE